MSGLSGSHSGLLFVLYHTLYIASNVSSLLSLQYIAGLERCLSASHLKPSVKVGEIDPGT